MLDLLKKIGMPATMAAVIAVLVVATPLMFTVDERYAKRTDVKELIVDLRKENELLKRELAEVIGTQKLMVAFIQAGKIPTPVRQMSFEDSTPESSDFVRIGWFQDLKDSIRKRRAQEKADEAAQQATPPEPPASSAPAPLTEAQKAQAIAAAKAELSKTERAIPAQKPEPRNWKELGERLEVQQQRIYKE